MIQLLFLVLLAEGVVALLLMVKAGPLRGLAMRAVDQVKTGKGLATMKMLACTLAVILISSVTSILKIRILYKLPTRFYMALLYAVTTVILTWIYYSQIYHRHRAKKSQGKLEPS